MYPCATEQHNLHKDRRNKSNILCGLLEINKHWFWVPPKQAAFSNKQNWCWLADNIKPISSWKPIIPVEKE